MLRLPEPQSDIAVASKVPGNRRNFSFIYEIWITMQSLCAFLWFCSFSDLTMGYYRQQYSKIEAEQYPNKFIF